MSRRRERRRSERIDQRAAARHDAGEIDELVAMMRPHMAAIGDDLAAVTDPFEAELAGGAILGLLAGLEQLDSERAALRLVEDVALQGDTSARALLVFMGLGPDPNLASLARQADAVLGAAGVADPVWADALHLPVEPTRFTKITVPGDRMEAWLLALFRRSNEEHGFLVGVDYTDCGAITMLDPVPPGHVHDLVERVEAGELLDDIPTIAEDLDEEQARVFLDGAIGATLDHWAEEDDDGPEDDLEADLLPGRIILLGRRLNEAGLVGEQPGHGGHIPARAKADTVITELDFQALPLPPKRSSRASRIFQLRVDLDRSDPPIWRRLEVPADTALAELHDILQAAFAWTGSHAHCFVTPFGEFGADAALTCENEADVAIEQVLSEPEDAITYMYDFADNWDHTITVEAVHDPEDDKAYPRCIAGAEAAPPEEAGGMEAWQHLREALADPAHPDHRQLIDEFVEGDLEPFDPSNINARLRTPTIPE
ncbi:plasmid pRiA4b ORF-3 family protein [Glycomyces tarimensis]